MQHLKNILLPLLIILVTQGLHYRWDTTQDKRYTLNESTETLLRNLDRPLKM